MGCQPNSAGASGRSTIEIVVNGEARSVGSGSTLLGVLQGLGLDPSRVAVELDRQIVRRDRWEDCAIVPGARLEIVQFVGGG